jgi:hypothetical protein
MKYNTYERVYTRRSERVEGITPETCRQMRQVVKILYSAKFSKNKLAVPAAM